MTDGSLVPTLRVGMPAATLCVASRAIGHGTRGVEDGVPTRSVGTRPERSASHREGRLTQENFMAVSVDKNPAIKSERHPLDATCINTIRTLAMDAVQAANSGHPGTPMAPGAGGVLPLAVRPAVRPAGPDLARPRPLRPVERPRLDAALLAPAPDRRQVGQQGLRDAGRAVGDARRHQALPPAPQQVPGPPGVPPDLGRRDHHRPARAGGGQQRRHGAVGAVDGGALQPARVRRPDRLQRLRHLRRRRHDGGDQLGGGLARRALAAVEPLLDLRQQPHHDRGEHQPGVLRGRGRPLHRLRLERHPRRRRQRPRPAGPRLRGLPRRAAEADA